MEGPSVDFRMAVRTRLLSAASERIPPWQRGPDCFTGFLGSGTQPRKINAGDGPIFHSELTVDDHGIDIASDAAFNHALHGISHRPVVDSAAAVAPKRKKSRRDLVCMTSPRYGWPGVRYCRYAVCAVQYLEGLCMRYKKCAAGRSSRQQRERAGRTEPARRCAGRLRLRAFEPSYGVVVHWPPAVAHGCTGAQSPSLFIHLRSRARSAAPNADQRGHRLTA